MTGLKVKPEDLFTLFQKLTDENLRVSDIATLHAAVAACSSLFMFKAAWLAIDPFNLPLTLDDAWYPSPCLRSQMTVSGRCGGIWTTCRYEV